MPCLDEGKPLRDERSDLLLLKEAKTLRLTSIGWGPRHDALGVFPTLESLSAQGIVLLGCLLVAVLPTLRRRTPDSRRAPDPTATT